MATFFVGKMLLEIAPITTVITCSITTICALIDSLTKKSGNNTIDPDISEFIESLDIKTKINTYGLLIKEFPRTNSKVVKNSLFNVKNAILEIENHLRNIKKKTDYNNSLWIFQRLRSHSFNKDLKILENLVNKLTGRIEDLKNVTQITKLWNDKLFLSGFNSFSEFDDNEEFEIINNKNNY